MKLKEKWKPPMLSSLNHRQEKLNFPLQVWNFMLLKKEYFNLFVLFKLIFKEDLEFAFFKEIIKLHVCWYCVVIEIAATSKSVFVYFFNTRWLFWDFIVILVCTPHGLFCGIHFTTTCCLALLVAGLNFSLSCFVSGKFLNFLSVPISCRKLSLSPF